MKLLVILKPLLAIILIFLTLTGLICSYLDSESEWHSVSMIIGWGSLLILIMNFVYWMHLTDCIVNRLPKLYESFKELIACTYLRKNVFLFR